MGRIGRLRFSWLLDRTILRLQGEEGSGETIRKLKEAVRVAAGGENPVVCLGRLGEGWMGEEALVIAVFCALRAKNLEVSWMVIYLPRSGDFYLPFPIILEIPLSCPPHTITGR